MLSCLLYSPNVLVREVSSFEKNSIKFYYNLPPNTIALFCTAVQCLGLFLLILSYTIISPNVDLFCESSLRLQEIPKYLTVPPGSTLSDHYRSQEETRCNSGAEMLQAPYEINNQYEFLNLCCDLLYLC